MRSTLLSLLFISSLVLPAYADDELRPKPCGNRAGSAGFSPQYAVVLVHGLSEHDEVWDDAVQRCAQIPVAIYSFDADLPWTNRTAVTTHGLGGELAARLDSPELRERRLVIIAHSLGGLIARSYMQDWGGGTRTLRLITLATPHRGTAKEANLTALGVGAAFLTSHPLGWALATLLADASVSGYVRDLRPDSDVGNRWLRCLNNFRGSRLRSPDCEEYWDRPGFYDKVIAYGAQTGDSWVLPRESALGGDGLTFARQWWATCEPPAPPGLQGLGPKNWQRAVAGHQLAHQLMYTNNCVVSPRQIGLLDHVVLDILTAVMADAFRDVVDALDAADRDPSLQSLERLQDLFNRLRQLSPNP